MKFFTASVPARLIAGLALSDKQTGQAAQMGANKNLLAKNNSGFNINGTLIDIYSKEVNFTEENNNRCN